MIYIVILTWNNSDDFVACTTRLIAYTQTPAALVIVENGSREEHKRVIDGVIGETLKTRKEHIEVAAYLENDRNLGIPAGQNQALDWIAAHDSGPYGVVCLDADTAPTEGWLSKLLQAGEDMPYAGVIGGSKSRNGDPCPVYYHDDGRWYVHSRQWQTSDFREGECVDFACAYLNPEILARGMRFDEAYRIYDGYDQDLAFRVRSWGYKVMQIDAGVTHYASAVMKREGYKWEGGGRQEWDQLRAANTARFAKLWQSFLAAQRKTIEEEIEHMAMMNAKLIAEAGALKNVPKGGQK